MKAYKIEIFVIDYDEIGSDDIKETIENASFPNDCISLKIKNIIEKDIGEWHDDHPLNKRATCDEEYKKLFPKTKDRDDLLALIKLIRYSDSRSWKVGQSGGQDSYLGQPDIMRVIDTELKKIGINLMEKTK